MIKEYGKSAAGRQRGVPRGVLMRRVLIALVALCLVSILVKVGAGLDLPVLFPIRRVQIYGNGFVDKKDVLAGIGLDANRSILTFNKAAAKRSLARDGRVAGAEIVKMYPDALRIYVVEKQKAMILVSDGGAYWLAGDGTVLGAAGEVLEGPFVTLDSDNDDIRIGAKTGNVLVGGILEAAGEMAKEYPGFYGLIGSFSVERDGAHLHLLDERFRIYLGTAVTKEKLERLRALLLVLNTTNPAGKRHRAFEIDMSFSQAAVLEREE